MAVFCHDECLFGIGFEKSVSHFLHMFSNATFSMNSLYMTDCCGVYYLFCYTITQDSSSDDDCRDTDIKKRLNRSAQLTPIEQQLVAELDSLPKPKRKRKHKRKKSQKSAKANAEDENSKVNSRYCYCYQ